MNTEYTYIDGKVIVSDEYGNKIQAEYYDNLDKVLIQENVIETIDNRIKELQKEKDSYDIKKVNKRYRPIYMYICTAAAFICPLIIWPLTGTNPYLVNEITKLGEINQGLLWAMYSAGIALPLGATCTWAEYTAHKAAIKNLKGINSELEFLKLQLEKEKNYLNNLKNDKCREKENTEFRSEKVNDLDELRDLRNCMSLYYNLGSNDKKYYKYYTQGKLDKKLQKEYDVISIEKAKKYFEEKGPTLVLKRKHNK